jgi:hypothetical protein
MAASGVCRYAELGVRLSLAAIWARLRLARLTIAKNQTLYNGFVYMHLGVLRRGLSSKRAVGEPPRTRTENRLIKSPSLTASGRPVAHSLPFAPIRFELDFTLASFRG